MLHRQRPNGGMNRITAYRQVKEEHMEEYHQMTLTEWMDLKDRLRRELNNLRTSFVRVGYVLRRMEDTKAYEAEGYKSVFEFAEKEHGLKPSTTSRWMSINREYSVDGYSEQLDPRYIDMNASQLTEMLSLPDKDRELVRPETPREEIRELRRFNKDSRAAGAPEQTPVIKAFITCLTSLPDVAERVRACMKSGRTDAMHLSEAVAPSGSRMFRAGTRFLAFSTADIKVKTFGGGQETVTWSEFAEAAEIWMREQDAEGAEEQKDEGSYRASEGEKEAESEVSAAGPAGREEGPADQPVEDARGNEDLGAEEAEEEVEEPDMNLPEGWEEEAVAPAQNARKAEQKVPIPEQKMPVPEQKMPVPEQKVPAPEQKMPVPERRGVTDISKIPSIVDEDGQPSPDPEERAGDILEKCGADVRRKLVNAMSAIDENIDRQNWKTARREAERLVRLLKQVEEFAGR